MHIQRNISTINDCFLKTKQTFTICSKQNFIKLQNVRDPYEYIYIYIYIYIYLHRYVFCPSQDSSVWLGLTSREWYDRSAQSIKCWALPKCGVLNKQKSFCSHQCSPECSSYIYIYILYIYIYIWFFFFNVFINHFLKIHRSVLSKITIDLLYFWDACAINLSRSMAYSRRSVFI